VESFPDGKHLNAAIAEKTLVPQSVLWTQCKVEVYAPDAGRELGGPGGIRMYHCPTYLHCVIRQQQHLPPGGDRIEPGLAARCEQIARQRSRKRSFADTFTDAVFPQEQCVTHVVSAAS